MSLSITRKAPFEEPTKWKQKHLSSDITSDANILEFNNLTAGKTYRYTANITTQIDPDVDTQVTLVLKEGSNSIKQVAVVESSASGAGETNAILLTTFYHVFSATETSVKIYATSLSSSALVKGNDTIYETWAILEELPNHADAGTIWD